MIKIFLSLLFFQCSMSVTTRVSEQHPCIGDTVTVGATPSGGTPPYTYSWAAYYSALEGVRSQYTDTINTVQRTVNINGYAVYTVTVTDSKGCAGVGYGSMVEVKKCK